MRKARVFKTIRTQGMRDVVEVSGAGVLCDLYAHQPSRALIRVHMRRKYNECVQYAFQYF